MRFADGNVAVVTCQPLFFGEAVARRGRSFRGCGALPITTPMRPEMRPLVLRLRAAALLVRGRRAPKTAVRAVLALGAGPVPSALATPVGTVTQDTTAHTITFTGTAAVNDVQLTYRNGHYVIEDNGAAAAANGVSAGLGCYPEDNVSTTAMTCDSVSNGNSPSRVIINLGDGDDRFYSILGLPDLNTFE